MFIIIVITWLKIFDEDTFAWKEEEENQQPSYLSRASADTTADVEVVELLQKPASVVISWKNGFTRKLSPFLAGRWGARVHRSAEPWESLRGAPKDLHIWHHLRPRLQAARCIQQGGQTCCGVRSGGIQWFVLPTSLFSSLSLCGMETHPPPFFPMGYQSLLCA